MVNVSRCRKRQSFFSHRQVSAAAPLMWWWNWIWAKRNELPKTPALMNIWVIRNSWPRIPLCLRRGEVRIRERLRKKRHGSNLSNALSQTDSLQVFSNVSVFTCSWFYLINVKTRSFLHCGYVWRCHESASISSIFWNPSSCRQLSCYLTPLSAVEQQKHHSALEAKKHVNKLKGDPKESHGFDCWLRKPFPPILTWPHMWLEGPRTHAIPLLQGKHLNTGGPSRGRLVVPNGDSEGDGWALHLNCHAKKVAEWGRRGGGEQGERGVNSWYYWLTL